MRALRSRQVRITALLWFAFAVTVAVWAVRGDGIAPVFAVLSLGLLTALSVAALAWRLRGEIDLRIATQLRLWRLKRLRVVRETLPAYRFVDAFRAIEAITCDRDASVLDAATDESLNDVLHVENPKWYCRRIHKSSSKQWSTAAGRKELFPLDRFWLLAGKSAGEQQVIRLTYEEQKSRVVVEVADRDSERARALVSEVIDRSARDSVYRGQILEVGFRADVRDEYGDVEQAGALVVGFPEAKPVTDDDIVLDAPTLRVLRRNVVDLHRRSVLLKAHGVPTRRGVLLYGPPGTGKTFACRYLCSELPDVTRIFVAGTALAEIKLIVQLARLFTPSLILLEDVDLVIPSRAISGGSQLLADLLDAMDGVRPNEDISFLLTTNSLDRIETAIKDRPGRISQCVYMGPPCSGLRRRYLEHYLEPYDIDRVDLGRLVRLSQGATQAFLKDWVHRAVQIALERPDLPDCGLQPNGSDFTAALAEMQHREVVANRIVGFLGESNGAGKGTYATSRPT